MKKITGTLLIILCIFSFAKGQPKTKSDFNRKPKKTNHLKTGFTPQQTAIKFLKWYVNNQSRLDKINPVSGVVGDSTKPYRINFDSVEVFLEGLKKSGFVSDRYLNSYRDKFRNIDQELIKSRQYDGPILGLGYDIVLNMMEYEELTRNLGRLKVVFHHVHDGRALLLFSLKNELTLIFVIEKGLNTDNKWLILELMTRFV